MIVCHCNVVTCRDLAGAVRDGAGSLGEVCRRTGAAQKCGGCVFSVRQLVCDHLANPVVSTQEPVRAAS